MRPVTDFRRDHGRRHVTVTLPESASGFSLGIPESAVYGVCLWGIPSDALRTARRLYPVIPAAILGFSVGTAIAWWVVLRSLSHGESDLKTTVQWDPMASVQWDPYVSQVTRSFLIDCE